MSSKELPVIRKLRIRFIALAMTSLFVLLSLIVTGMNIINYNKIVGDADARLEVLEQNSDRIMGMGPGMPGGPENDFFFGKGGPAGRRMSMDEAEESRFFIVAVDGDGNVKDANINRISAVDDAEAAEYAGKAIESGKLSGFIGEFRYRMSEQSDGMTITFLDCGRTLESFRAFLRASIIMSLIGLAIVFGIICYFSGRIIRPVAESYEKQKRFVTDAGHEIKTPLAIIKANLDVINLDPGSTEESLREIGDQVDRLSGLTNDLVYLSRMEESENDIIMADVPISDVAIETAASFETLSKERNKTIETDIEPMLSINGSTKEIEKLLSILLENAVKYSDESEPIRLSLKRDTRNVVLEVTNRTREEINNESLSHVFERFYRTDESRNSETGGHGIGLSMAAAIVKAHGGRINARTTDGRDFIIDISIPTA